MRIVPVYCLVEGQTEEQYARHALKPYLDTHHVDLSVRLVATKGGLRRYQDLKTDLSFWRRENPSPQARFTTMIDLYGLRHLKDEFPGIKNLPSNLDPDAKVQALEEAFEKDIADPRFIPYIQLHEFEALILTAPDFLRRCFPDSRDGIQNLTQLAQNSKPEWVNDNDPPSKRIIREIPEYESRKFSGAQVAERIGVSRLRVSCPHFGNWLDTLENLAKTSA